MTRVRQLGSLTLGVSDLSAWREFAERVLGMEAVENADDGSLCLRMDERESRLLLREDPADDLLSLGFEVDNEAALEALCERLEAAGRPVERADASDARRARVAGLARSEDPNGTPIELAYGPRLRFEEPFRSPHAHAGFVTGALGLGHAVVTVRDQAQSLAFYRDLLGLRVSDFIQFEPAPGFELELTFLHCNPRHHSLALIPTPGGKRLHHFMVEFKDLDDVGRAFGVCEDRALPIAMTLGRHTNDHMVSFYAITPSGFQVEIGWGGRLVDDATWRVETHQAISIWGHRPAGASA